MPSAVFAPTGRAAVARSSAITGLHPIAWHSTTLGLQTLGLQRVDEEL